MTTQTNCPLTSLLPIHNAKYRSDIQSWGRMPSQSTTIAISRKTTHQTAKFKTTIAYDTYKEEWFAFKIYDTTKTLQNFMFNVLNRKQLLGKERLNDFNVREFITFFILGILLSVENKNEKDYNVKILKSNIQISPQTSIHLEKCKLLICLRF